MLLKISEGQHPTYFIKNLNPAHARLVFHSRKKGWLVDFFRNSGHRICTTHSGEIKGFYGQYTKTRGARSEMQDALNLRHQGWGTQGAIGGVASPGSVISTHIPSIPLAGDAIDKVCDRLPSLLTTGRHFVGFIFVRTDPHTRNGGKEPSFMYRQKRLHPFIQGGRIAFNDVAEALEHKGWQGTVELP